METMRFALLSLLLLAPGVATDALIVELQGGTFLRATSVEEEGDKYKIELARGGEVSFEQAMVARVWTEEELLAEFEKQHAQVRGKARKLYELSKWCAERTLKDRQIDVLREVLAADPHHTKAKRDLEKLGVVPSAKKPEPAGDLPAPAAGEERPWSAKDSSRVAKLVRGCFSGGNLKEKGLKKLRKDDYIPFPEAKKL
ncbi:MAG: hypothetical protein ACYTAF_12155, partial [Planctomycetota bacterium]